MIRKIKRLSKNKDARTLVSNFTYLSILQVAGYVFPIITLPYLAKVIGVAKFGEIAFASAIILYFQTIVDWGFMYSATRDIARNRDNVEEISQIFSNVLWSKLFMMILSMIILIILILTIPMLHKISTLLLICFCLIPGHIMFPDWLFQGLERMKYTTLLNLLSKLLFTVAVFLFIKDEADYIYQPLFISLGYLMSGCIAMYIIIFKWKIKLQRPNYVEIKKTMKNSSDIFINQLMPNLYNNFSVMMLGIFGGPAANGQLDAGSKFVNISSQFMSIITRVFYPFLSRKINIHAIYAKVNIWLSVFIAIILFLSAPIIVKIFLTPEFSGAVLIIRIMSLSIVFLTLCSVYGTSYLILNGEEKKLRKITIISSLIGFSMSIPMIYFFDYIGAALTITTTRGILGFSSYFASKNTYR